THKSDRNGPEDDHDPDNDGCYRDLGLSRSVAGAQVLPHDLARLHANVSRGELRPGLTAHGLKGVVGSGLVGKFNEGCWHLSVLQVKVLTLLLLNVSVQLLESA